MGGLRGKRSMLRGRGSMLRVRRGKQHSVKRKIFPKDFHKCRIDL
jgi:hypothetical protein